MRTAVAVRETHCVSDGNAARRGPNRPSPVWIHPPLATTIQEGHPSGGFFMPEKKPSALHGWMKTAVAQWVQRLPSPEISSCRQSHCMPLSIVAHSAKTALVSRNVSQ